MPKQGTTESSRLDQNVAKFRASETASKLLFGATEISSEMGVQQGDPLGPLLFSLTLQPLLRELASHRAANKLELEFPVYLESFSVFSLIKLAYKIGN